MSAFAALGAAVAAVDPQAQASLPLVEGRKLLADGDGLAYYCAGSDEQPAHQARANLLDKLRSAKAACGASDVTILLTGRGSHKGHRYAVASVKSYQGQRDGGRRPVNWEHLRDTLEAWAEKPPYEWLTVHITDEQEADDLFGTYADTHPDCVIYTQDKDMRMVPGKHLEWKTHRLFELGRDTFAAVHDDKVWGRKWFWLQMLQGDTADNIPGLPFYVEAGKQKRIGEKGALAALEPATNDAEAGRIVQRLYASFYGELALEHMLEQAVLLWMRRSPDVLDCLRPGGPLAEMYGNVAGYAAVKIINQRIENVPNGASEDQGSGSGDSASAATPSEWWALCLVQAAVPA